MQTGNYTIVGSGLDNFVETVRLLLAHNWLWSSVCDKKGDWLVSTDDDVPLDEVVAVLRASSVTWFEIVNYGELTTCVEDVPEFNEVMEMEPIVEVNRCTE